jgi:hypothetical protein
MYKMPTKIKQNQKQDMVEPQGRDLFQTPNYAVDLLIPFIPSDVSIIWECACGERKISKRLEEKGYCVLSSDIRKNIGVKISNFLFENPFQSKYDAIITNPPFSLKKAFYERCCWFSHPFALLIPADYCSWIINAIRNDGAEKIIPTRRIDYITPTGLTSQTGHTSKFHSIWLTWGFDLGKTETFVELTKEMKENI